MSRKSFVIHPADRMNALPKQFFASLVGKVNAQISAGKDVINLGQGNPDLPTPGHIVRELQAAADNVKFHKYPPFSGYDFLKEAIAERYRLDYGVSLDPQTQVAILFGGKTGLVEVSQVLLNPGDVCLVPDPGYPDYWSGVALAGGRMVFMPLLESNAYLPDLRAISPHDRAQAKMVFFNYPNNPTSAVAPLSFYEDMVKFCAANQIIAISDFAYGAIGFQSERPISFLQAPGATDVGIEIYTLSKTYNMAGWRVGFALGNKEVIRLINLMQDHYYVSLFGAIQAASAEALRSSQSCVDQLVATYKTRRDALFEALATIGWHAAKPQGSFFCWLPTPRGTSSLELADLLLERAHVMVAPGIGFGQHGERYVRLGLLTSDERLQEAVERIGKLHIFE
jgi:aminotransferase